MRAERLKLSFFAPKKLCGGRIVNRSETRTTPILDRCASAKLNRHQIKQNKKMKTIFFTLIFIFFSMISFAQNQTNPNREVQQKVVFKNSVYQLFPTQNYWTFIKLNTRNGKMWQVHFTVEKDGTDGELILNSIPLVDEEKEVNGRFTLYPTENIYNFLLLDQIDGIVYQVQWSVDSDKRGIVSIIETVEE